MCRHLGYLGPPLPLRDLLFDAPHSLEHQSWAPSDMRGGGTINADGFGIVWYDTVTGRPVRYRRDRPLWSDSDLPALAGVVRAGAILAAVRSATVGMPVTEPAAAPFLDGRWAFSHNGVVAGWPDSVTELAGGLPVRDLLTLDAPTDSALLWALVRDRLRGGAELGRAEPGGAELSRAEPGGAELGRAVAGVVADVAAAAPGSRLNLLVTDGSVLVATALGHALSVRAATASVLVSSEPVDHSPGWIPVPDGHLLVATQSTVDITPLPDQVRTP